VRRMLVGGVPVVAGAGLATAAIMALVDTSDVHRRDPTVRLSVDAAPTPWTLTPGGSFVYEFKVANIGTKTVTNVAVRSGKVAEGRAGTDLNVVSVSDRSCSGSGRVACLFHRLAPGESRTVRVEAKTATTRKPGDTLTIKTFLAEMVPGVGKGVDYDMIGKPLTTTGRFG
jgi:hypothetical protein